MHAYSRERLQEEWEDVTDATTRNEKKKKKLDSTREGRTKRGRQRGERHLTRRSASSPSCTAALVNRFLLCSSLA